jgi:hypothetical protein
MELLLGVIIAGCAGWIACSIYWARYHERQVTLLVIGRSAEPRPLELEPTKVVAKVVQALPPPKGRKRR